MNLVKLLKVGRSLKEGKTIFGKYKFTQQTLPKFASTVRPTGSAAVKESLLAKARAAAGIASAPTLVEATKAVSASTVDAKATVPSVLDKTQRIPAGKILRRIEAPVLKEDRIFLSTRIAEKISGWKKKLTPARSRKNSRVAPVQTEWALGQVTVARNDLTESDLEVVALKRVLPTIKSAAPQIAAVRTSGRRWIKMTTGLFKTTSPFEQPAPEKSFEKVETEVASPELAGRI